MPGWKAETVYIGSQQQKGYFVTACPAFLAPHAAQGRKRPVELRDIMTEAYSTFSSIADAGRALHVSDRYLNKRLAAAMPVNGWKTVLWRNYEISVRATAEEL